LSDAYCGPLTSGDGIAHAGFDQREGVFLAALPRGEHRRCIERTFASDRLHHHSRLIDEGRRRFLFAGEHLRDDAYGDRAVRLAEGTGIAGDLHVAGGEAVEALVVPHISRDDRRDREGLQAVCDRDLLGCGTPATLAGPSAAQPSTHP
jgi:hypothetical protein